MWKKSTSAIVPATLVAGLVLTACGSSSGSGSSETKADPVAEIKASLATVKKAKTYHVVVDGTDQGQPIDLDLHYGNNGADGSVSMQGTTIQLKIIKTTVYFKAPSAFWREQGGAQGDAVAKMFGDKWVKTSTTSSFGKGFAEVSDGEKFLDGFIGSFEQDQLSGAKQVGTGSVDGVATKTYTDASKEGTIDIAASGTPYPLKIVSKPTKKNDSDAGTVTLTDWNKAYTVKAPATSVALPS